MDTCPLLMGRPWLFDSKVMHDGYLNNYTFQKDGKKITLAPLSPSQLHKIKPQKNQEHLDLLLTTKELLLKVSHHEFKDNLRANSPQQGEDDGDPPMTMITYPQGGPRPSDSMAKVQKTCLVCLSHSQPSSCFQPVHKPDCVHLFT